MARRLTIKENRFLSMNTNRFYFILVLLAGLPLVSFTPDYEGKRNCTRSSRASIEKIGHVSSAINRTTEDNPYYIVIDKSDYELKVFDDEGWYATYPIVFGSKDLSDKMKEGDRRTPDGKFKVILKKIHNQWGPELLLNYPNEESYQRFNDRKAKGLVPQNAKIGNGIAIHATRPQEEWTIDSYYNWTDGCVSVKYTEMKDLYSYILVGTPVTIQQ